MEFLLNFNSWYKGLPAGAKISLFLVVIGMFTAALLLQTHYKYTGYQYLFTNLNITDANAISERLQSMNVQVEMRGDAILVPGNRVLELRNMMASEGLPRGGGVGFEIFDQKNFGETEFQQRINYIRAIQGELARTISAIDGIEKARVHLVVPEKSLFAEDSKRPTASIAISLFKGRRISDSQVKGIVHLVTTSVEGLTESNINLIDQNGNSLFKASGDEGGSSGKHLELQASIEQNLERGVREMLERVVGSGGVTVKVSSVMNLAQIEKMEERIDPDSKTSLSETVSTDSSSGSSGAPGGTPGAAANLPDGNATGSSQSRSENSKRSETTTTFAVSKSTQKTIEPVGKIQKLSVAVLVDGTYKAAEDGTKTYQPRPAEEIAKLEELVKKAVGFNKDRGDEVRIENMQFQRLELDDKAQEAFVTATNSSHMKTFMMDNAKLFGVVLIAGFIFFMLVKLVNSYAPPINMAYANLIGQEAGKVAEALPPKATINIISREDPAAKDKANQIAQQLPQLERKASAGEINFVESQKSITIEAPTTSEEKLRLQAAKMQVEQIVKSDINETVKIIRQWMSED
ncbi:MAG: flagellar M-ring protein FliF [Deltaproteobacteria bacterium]|nr:flagellar M-ring protein FliF [Deltaproteobacteria bacterium]